MAVVREIWGRVSVSVLSIVSWTDVSAASPPPPVVFPASSVAPLSAAGTDSMPAWSSAGPKGEHGTGQCRVGGEVAEEVREGQHSWRVNK